MNARSTIKGALMAAGFAASLVVADVRLAAAEDVTLTMAVPDWPPTRIMKKFFDEQYKPKSGNTVKLDVDFIPWPDFYTRVNASLTSGEKKYNFIVSDSQWLGAFVEGGYFRKINDLLDADPEFMKTFMDHPSRRAQRLLDLSLQVAQLLRLPAVPRRARDLRAQGRPLQRESRRTSWRSTTRSCPARARRWTP